jgi:hypothetical protein
MRNFSHKFFTVLILITAFLTFIPNKVLASAQEESMRNVFSLGRGVGSTYFHLVNLSDKARFTSYTVLKKEYDDTFQSLNMMGVLLDDLKISSESQVLLEKLRFNFYHALKDADMNEVKILYIKNAYCLFYETLANDVEKQMPNDGNWLFTLGFYTSFQKESINSPDYSKLLLSGFNKILSANPIALPETVFTDLQQINNLDKESLTNTEIACLNQSIKEVMEYFGSYPSTEPLEQEITRISGNWQGVLIDPENQRRNIKLNINTDRTLVMDIDGIAQNISVDDIKLINNYFTFMFKPFGAEKLYIMFNAKVANNTLSGEVIDSLGQKGNWLLSKTN